MAICYHIHPLTLLECLASSKSTHFNGGHVPWQRRGVIAKEKAMTPLRCNSPLVNLWDFINFRRVISSKCFNPKENTFSFHYRFPAVVPAEKRLRGCVVSTARHPSGATTEPPPAPPDAQVRPHCESMLPSSGTSRSLHAKDLTSCFGLTVFRVSDKSDQTFYQTTHLLSWSSQCTCDGAVAMIRG